MALWVFGLVVDPTHTVTSHSVSSDDI
jgi:hypothetical protein